MSKFKKLYITGLILSLLSTVFIGLMYVSKLSKSNKPIVIELENNKIINNDFYGFGAETLPWLWTKGNLKQKINEDDIKLNIERIKEMELPLTRVFVPWEMWNPRADYKTFTFESDGMQSLYKTLDIYKEMNTSVIIVTVDWLRDSPWHDVKKSSSAVLKLLEYLVKRKGYSCIHFWTLTNEPELTYQWLKKLPFKNYIQIHKLIKEGLEKRKLSVKIICSDEVEARNWFKDSVESLFDFVDVFSSHRYPYPCEIELVSNFFKDRINIINSSTKEGSLKPFFLCEFGFRGYDFGSHNNSFMKSFDYSLLTAELCIDALNSGVSGVSIWCLHEIFMPDGKKMNIGLWGYKDENWKPRPVFYVYKLFTKYIKKGSQVLKVENEGYPNIKVARISYNGKKSIFVLNKTKSLYKIEIKGLERGEKLRKYLYSSSASIRNQQMIKSISVIRTRGFLKDEIPAKTFILYTTF